MLLPLLVAALVQDIPYHQDRPPNEARSPEEALAHFTLPEGFRLELVASEPELVNPIAMAFDGAGRLWVTESLEYPRMSAGPGRDRVKILSDEDHDGTFEHVEIFAEGLNIPSGIEVTPGAVFVANSPDILRWDRTDPGREAQVILTGFGRDDTHELPNSLTLGPDGSLYGLNGVFNHSHVEGLDFTVAAWRYDVVGGGFDLFAEGTSNPWGITFDPQGSLFVSACVIDHLWHLAQDVYYERQAGAYPPHTWKAGSIVDHEHQMAAYCGLHYLDSERYPDPYRGVMVMGNLHGGCLNVDRVAPAGSTYQAQGLPDLLTANDAWFMPVAMTTGPDGYLYVLDWYDRYHCYQDAGRDPEGLDRIKGRLWRVVYGEQEPVRWSGDLALENEAELVAHLSAPNDGLRRLARLELASRASDATFDRLEAMALDRGLDRTTRLEALFAIASGRGEPSDAGLLAMMDDPEAVLRAWGVRLAPRATPDSGVRARVAELARDPDPRVLLQVASAAPRLGDDDATGVLVTVLEHCGDDPVVPRVVWRHLHGRLADDPTVVLAALPTLAGQHAPAWDELVPRMIARLLAEDEGVAPAVALLARVAEDPALAADALVVLREHVQSGELTGDRLDELREELSESLERLLAGDLAERRTLEASLLATSWGDARGLSVARAVLASADAPSPRRRAALEALVSAGDSELLDTVAAVLIDDRTTPALRGELVATLGRLDDERVAAVVLDAWGALGPELYPRVVTLCLQRVTWARRLLDHMPDPVSPRLLSTGQALRLTAFEDQALADLLEERWGRVRAARNPDREAVIANARRLVRRGGDARLGEEVFARVCGVCHTMHGRGAEVGPDITGNGRGDLTQLLSNVFDPSLVVGAEYRQQIVRTVDGRVLGGLLIEDSERRVVLRVEGGEDEVVPREDVDASVPSSVSLMPEGFEAQLTEEELSDLLAFLVLEAPGGVPIPGARVEERETSDPAEFAAILAEVAPGFACDAVGDDGVALEAEHAGRAVVVRTHPVSATEPCVLYGSFDLPQGRSSRLALSIAHHARGDWRLVVRVGGEVLLDTPVDEETCTDGWLERWIDLTPWAGGTVELALENHASGWFNEYGYWARAEVVSGR